MARMSRAMTIGERSYPALAYSDNHEARAGHDPATTVPPAHHISAYGLISVWRTPPVTISPSHGGRGSDPAQPSSRCPIARNGRRSSQMILVIASIGTARIAPAMPHIQYQKI